MFAFSLTLGKPSPSFGEAGLAWVGWGKRFGPTALVGYIAGWVVWPIRVDTYDKFWMPVLGAGLALFVRTLYRQISGKAAAEMEATMAQQADNEPDIVAESTLVGAN